MRAPTPIFHQSGASIGSLLAATAGESVQTAAPSQSSALRSPSRPAAGPSVETLTSSVLHLVDESSSSKEEAVSLKRRIVEVGDETVGNEESRRGDPELAMAASEGGMALNIDTMPPLEDVEIAPLPEVIMEEVGRSEEAEVIPRSDPSSSGQADVPSSAKKKGRRGCRWL